MSLVLPPHDRSVFTVMTELAAQHGAVDLGAGVSHDSPPPVVVKAAADAMNMGRNSYSVTIGTLELRREVARSGSVADLYDPDTEVTIFSGGTEAIAASLLALTDPDDEVLTFEPFYDHYAAFATIARAKLVAVPLRDGANGFRLDARMLHERVSSSSRLLLLNSPHNPTGHVFDETELAAIADVATSAGLIVVADEVYEQYTYGVPHRSIATFPGMRTRTVVVSSASKTFHVTGWRVGWTVCDAELSRRLRACRQYQSYCAPVPLQYGVAAGLRWSRDTPYLANLRATFEHRRNLLCKALGDAAFDPILPRGTFFVLSRRGLWSAGDAIQMCTHLTVEGGVTPLPVQSFFRTPTHADSYLRFAFCRADETILTAAERLQRFYDRHL